ncbi:glycosyltransferase family 39 protein [Saccharopolyspora indica]|uniref:ArnT family glycosyltransferase n=1 Tax=Saccharopolyspora indica TaxID=1229659 RepID=UPI0022EAE1BB|nr:glycosyltransferase family 39 protein [Saccharopolyspora indica]MDA3647976.1 glycosyltransferase family 39 protein [Saccharopolyspora indica]
MAWTGVLLTAGVLTSAVLLCADRYGLHADELYFRLLGLRAPAWGYADQPPLLPLLYRGSIGVFGDTLWAVRVVGAMCFAAVVVLGALMTAELGGGRRAQLFAAAGLGTSFMVLLYGHYVLTSSVDLVAWCAVELAVLRALLRRDGRWWLVAGAVCGLAMYAKYIVLVLPVSLLVALALTGPRAVFRDRKLYAGAALALVLGSPNLVYQATHDFPQLQMAHALAKAHEHDGAGFFVLTLVSFIGFAQVLFCVVGALALWRERAWRPVRALVPGFLVGTLAVLLTNGGRGDYVAGYLVVLFAAGCVRTAAWSARGRLRNPAAAGLLALGAVVNLLLALPVLPVRALTHVTVNTLAVDSVGWQSLTEQVAAVHRGLPRDDRAAAAVLAGNYGEAGALDRYGPAHHLPAVYSGNNELHRLGPPPDSARVIIAISVDGNRLTADFADCRIAARADDRTGIDTTERHATITVCRNPRAPWRELWPRYRTLKSYGDP